jgi:DNA polymerase III subunit epsilon
MTAMASQAETTASAAALPAIAYVDLETTGTRPTRDGITEIGIVLEDEGDITAEWSTLLDPGVHIPWKIQELTGISNAMVRGAPLFGDVADEVAELLEGRLFVAHNARFDLGFLKNAFRRLGVDFTPRVLCTVKLSRCLFPHQSRHNLDTLKRVHGIHADQRHRALADAKSLHFVMQAFRQKVDAEALQAAMQAQFRRQALPPHLDAAMLEGIGNTPGVYLFYGENDVLLYVGKSVTLRSRILSHFSADSASDREMRMSQQVRRIETIDTAGELGALLLEAELVKRLQPTLNRQLRRCRSLCSIQWDIRGEGQPQVVALDHLDAENVPGLYGLFKTRRAALKALKQAAEDYRLCQKHLGLEKGPGACFGYQLHRCNGICVGEEPEMQHRIRMLEALLPLKIKAWPYEGRIGIRERHAGTGKTEIHVLDHWCYFGKAGSENELEDLFTTTSGPLDIDIYKILKRFLSGDGKLDIIHPQR